MKNEVKIESSKQESHAQKVGIVVEDPPDFSKEGLAHRKALIANSALILILVIASPKVPPKVFGIMLSLPLLWGCLAIVQFYFFAMWRITTPIERDQEKRFWNMRGLLTQALLKGTDNFPGKTKAQLVLLRALPIWAFLFGLLGIVVGFGRLVY